MTCVVRVGERGQVGEVGLNNVVRLTVLGRLSASAREGDKAVLTKRASERFGTKKSLCFGWLKQ